MLTSDASSSTLTREGVPVKPWTWQCHRPDQLEEAFASYTTRASHVESWSDRRSRVNYALNHGLADVGLAVLISLNVALVVVETNLAADAERELPTWMAAVNVAILIIFCLEVGLRLYVERRSFFQNYLSLFDLLVITVDAALTIARAATDLKSPIPVEVFRILRLLKIIRAVRLMMLFPELHLIIQCLAYAAKAILWAVFMLIVVLGFWAIFAVVLIHPLNVRIAKSGYWEEHRCERCPRAFESVQASMLTFIQQIIAGDSWGMVTVPIVEHYPLAGVFFFCVLISISMAVMNLILAVIVEKASEAREISLKEEAAKKEQEFLRASEKLFQICRAMDKDGSGFLTFDELWHGFHSNPDFASILAAMDMGESDLEVVFHILDTDGSSTVEYKEFVDQLHMMKNRESHTLLIFIKFYVMELRRNMQRIIKQRAQMDSVSSRSCSKSSHVCQTCSASARDIAEGRHFPESAELTNSSSSSDTTGVIRAALRANLELLDMQQELSSVLQRHRETCNARIRQVEMILSSSLDTVGGTEPGFARSVRCANACQDCAVAVGKGPEVEFSGFAHREALPAAKSAGRAPPATVTSQSSMSDQTVPCTACSLECSSSLSLSVRSVQV